MVMPPNTPHDTAESAVIEALNINDIAEASQSDYGALEDGFVLAANDILPEVDTVALEKAGFANLAQKLAAFEQASRAFNWARENL
ncbi:MAG: hypothetical protein GJ680_07555 [Alteromonadaceae bacterium]|nr:hypothetical protein [Alteromonadaceae bacterium]